MPSSRIKIAWLLVLVLGALALVGCGTQETPPPAGEVEVTEASAPEATAVVEATESEAPESEPTEALEAEQVEETETEPTPTQEPTPEPTPTPIVVVDVDSACVNCHTDIDRLKELAEEPEEVELSSGEG